MARARRKPIRATTQSTVTVVLHRSDPTGRPARSLPRLAVHPERDRTRRRGSVGAVPQLLRERRPGSACRPRSGGITTAGAASARSRERSRRPRRHLREAHHARERSSSAAGRSSSSRSSRPEPAKPGPIGLTARRFEVLASGPGCPRSRRVAAVRRKPEEANGQSRKRVTPRRWRYCTGPSRHLLTTARSTRHTPRPPSLIAGSSPVRTSRYAAACVTPSSAATCSRVRNRAAGVGASPSRRASRSGGAWAVRSHEIHFAARRALLRRSRPRGRCLPTDIIRRSPQPSADQRLAPRPEDRRSRELPSLWGSSDGAHGDVTCSRIRGHPAFEGR